MRPGNCTLVATSEKGILLDEGARLKHGVYLDTENASTGYITIGKRVYVGTGCCLHGHNGLEIGDGIGTYGSCGTAAFRNERVVVEDVREHRYWASGRELAERAGLVSCWSEPIRDSAGKVLGTLLVVAGLVVIARA